MDIQVPNYKGWVSKSWNNYKIESYPCINHHLQVLIV